MSDIYPAKDQRLALLELIKALAPNRISQATAASQRHFSLVKVLQRTQSQPQ